MALNIKPIAGTDNRVWVEAAPAEEKTASGIYIPDTAKEKPLKGTVVAISAKDKDGNIPEVKVGDTVLYGNSVQYGDNATIETTYEGKEYLIMKEANIYAVVS